MDDKRATREKEIQRPKPKVYTVNFTLYTKQVYTVNRRKFEDWHLAWLKSVFTENFLVKNQEMLWLKS